MVRFSLPGGRSIECRRMIVHLQPGVRMGIRFLGLDYDGQKAIADYVEEVKAYTRRSTRLARRLSVVLRWHDLEGNCQEHSAETAALSRHGGLLVCRIRFKPGQEVYLWWPEQ